MLVVKPFFRPPISTEFHLTLCLVRAAEKVQQTILVCAYLTNFNGKQLDCFLEKHTVSVIVNINY